MNRKCSFESLLCGKSEAGGGKEVTQGLLTSGKLVSIPPQRNRGKAAELARNPHRSSKHKERAGFPQNSYFRAAVPSKHIPPAYLNIFSKLEKMLSSGCLHHHSHQMVLHPEVGSSQRAPIGVRGRGQATCAANTKKCHCRNYSHA